MRQHTVLALKSSILSIFFLFISIQTSANTDIEQLRDHVAYLASDKLCGRLPTSKGEKRAANYIKKQFKQYGLEPLPSLGSYYHHATIPTDLVESKRVTELNTEDGRPIRIARKSLVFLNPTSNITFKGTLESISDRALFTGLASLKGKAIVLHVSDTPFFNQFPDTGFRALLTLAAEQAYKREAEALLVSVSNPQFFNEGSQGSAHEKQGRVGHLHDWFADIPLPLAMIDQSIWEKLHDAASNENISIKHHSTNHISIGTYTNVVGFVKGNTDKAIVIGAHFDHLGSNAKGLFSCRQVYNGADDNASGTAVLTQLAKRFSKSETKPRHNLIFAAFSAEELGLLGSKALAEYFENEGLSIEAMINFDMLGHPNRAVEVKGSELSSDWNKWFQANSTLEDPTTLNDAGFYPRSDHGSFIKHGIPSVIFSTGTHRRYHRTTDETSHINFDGMYRILEKGESFIRFVDEQNTTDYLPQIRANVTRWKIGDFDVIESLYNGSLLSKKLLPFNSSSQFEWDLGLSEPPRKTALEISKKSSSELIIKVNRFQDFKVVSESEQVVTLGEKSSLTLPIDSGNIDIEIEAISQ